MEWSDIWHIIPWMMDEQIGGYHGLKHRDMYSHITSSIACRRQAYTCTPPISISVRTPAEMCTVGFRLSDKETRFVWFQLMEMKDIDGNLPIHLAAISGDLKSVHICLRRGILNFNDSLPAWLVAWLADSLADRLYNAGLPPRVSYNYNITISQAHWTKTIALQHISTVTIFWRTWR